MKKGLLFVVSMIMVVSMLVACLPKTEVVPTAAETTEAPVAKLPEKIVVAIGADPADLSPFTGMSMGRIAVLKTIYEYLLETDSMGTEAVPMIAKKVEKVGDKTYNVTIFDYVTDSAGNKITAADVAFSYNAGMASGKMRPLGDVVSVTALDAVTAQFVFKVDFGPGGLDKILTEAPIVSQAAYETSPDKFATKPVTTGPYVLTEYVPGSSLTFEKNANYWQYDELYRTLFSKANVEKIVFQVITEKAQNAVALETGTAHISAAVAGEDVSRFSSNSKFTVFKFLDNLTQLVAFNGITGHPFTNQSLRQAVAYAIDTAAMCEAVAPGACEAAHTIGNKNFGGYLTKWDTESYYEYDLAKAQQAFAASGFKSGQLTFKLLGQNDTNTGLIAQIIQAALQKLGITVTINQVEPAVYNNLATDPTAFDLLINAAAGGDFIFSPWQLSYDQNRNKGTTSNFFKDDQLQALLNTASSVAGFNPTNVDAFQQYQKEKMYMYGLLSFMNNVVAVKGITKVVRDTRGQLIPGAFEFAADFK